MDWIEKGSQLVILLIGIVGILTFFIGLVKGWGKIFKGLMSSIKKLSFFIERCNYFFDNFVPSILQGLENKNILKDGTSSGWATYCSQQATTYAENSPLTIIKKGQDILKELDFANFIKNNEDKIFTELEQKIKKRFENPVKYDVEVMSIDYVTDNFDKSEYSFLRKYLYNNPKFRKPELLVLMGLAIRDEYFKKHPEIE